MGRDLESEYFKQIEQQITVADDVCEFLEIINSLVDDIDQNFDNLGDEPVLKLLRSKSHSHQNSIHFKNLKLQIRFVQEYQNMICQVKKEISERFQLVAEYRKGLEVVISVT